MYLTPKSTLLNVFAYSSTVEYLGVLTWSESLYFSVTLNGPKLLVNLTPLVL